MTHELELTQQHLDLLSNLEMSDVDTDYNSTPQFDDKRPYGRSGYDRVAHDIAEILGIPEVDYDHEDHDEFVRDMHDIHVELKDALKIILTTQSFKLGKYKKVGNGSDSKWEYVD